MNLQTLLEITDEIKQDCFDLKESWHEDDVRHSFFGLFYTTIYDFYIGKVAYRMSEYIGSGDIKFTREVINFKSHAKRLFEIQDNNMLSIGYNNKLNRDVYIGTWTSFETSIAILFENLSTDTDKLNIISDLNYKILKVISKLEDPEKSALKEITLKSQFIPIGRKFKFLRYLEPDNYIISEYKKDVKFIEFCSKLRNCLIHTNGIYYGKDSEFDFMGCKFNFINGQVFEQENSNEYTMFHIAFELRNIFFRLTKSLQKFEYIEYPNDGQNIA
ncbi:hypothetical protein [Hyunsoonleella rubra]|uniref:Uncharacterized protein n=1 Tax=Hyunsoonleella rubra TaxID=1737062 RepID=A0ABW5TDU4_9FLAO